MKKETAAVKGTVVEIGQGIGSIGTSLGDLRIVPKKPKAAPRALSQPAVLPDLDAFQVKLESFEEIAARVEAAKKLGEYARRAATIVVTIRERREQILAIKEQIEGLTPELQQELVSLDASEEQILGAGGDADIRERIYFVLFVEDIKSAPVREDVAEELLRRAVEKGRFRLAEKGEIAALHFATKEPYVGPQRLGGTTYVPCFDSRQDKGQFALEAELGKYLARVNKTFVAEKAASMEEMIGSCNPDLGMLSRGIKGRYVLRVRERRAEGAKPMLPAGSCILSLDSKKKREGDGAMLVIRVVAGEGRFAWMNDRAGSWISFGSYKRGVSAANLEAELLEFSNQVIRIIANAVAFWGNPSGRR